MWNKCVDNFFEESAMNTWASKNLHHAKINNTEHAKLLQAHKQKQHKTLA